MLSGNAQFAHLINESGACKTKPRGSPAFAAYNPVCILQSAENARPFGFLQRIDASGCLWWRNKRILQFVIGKAEYPIGRKDNGSLNYILKFADVSGPV